jgi:DNA-binding CsgD family transcriptional regulator
MDERSSLRPLERRILRLTDDGVPEGEIARRFRHSVDFIRRVRLLAEVPRRPMGDADLLRPIERRILRLRAAGEDRRRVADRFHRSPAFVDRVERLAQYKLTK